MTVITIKQYKELSLNYFKEINGLFYRHINLSTINNDPKIGDKVSAIESHCITDVNGPRAQYKIVQLVII